jgi:glycosyltransferase involved in cell wall biosynthesis
VFLDVNGLRLTGRRFGVGRYIEYLLRNWTDLDGGFEGIRLYTPRPLDSPFELPACVDHRIVPTAGPNGWWEQVVLPRRHDPRDLLFCPSYVVPLAARGKVVVTHLGSYEAVPGEFALRDRLKSRLLYQASARRAARVITVSESAKADIVRFYGVRPQKVMVIPLGVDPRFRPLADEPRLADARRRLLGEDRPFVLFVGKFSRRRNIPALIEAFGRAKRTRGLPHALVLVGENTSGHDIEALAAASGLERDLVTRPYEEHETLLELYNAADAFVYPSSYEGFGIPVLEAMACGVPTIALRNTAFLEFATAAYLAENATIGELQHALETVLLDDRLRLRLSQEGVVRARDYHWGRIAQRTLEVLREVAQS